MDVQMTQKKKPVRRTALGHLIGLNFLFHNIPIITAEKRTVKPKDAFKDIAFRVPLKFFKF
jgi:hypothetical protein